MTAEYGLSCTEPIVCYLEMVAFLKGNSPDSEIMMFFHLLSIAILTGLAGLVVYELVTEVRSAGEGLHDRYHE